MVKPKLDTFLNQFRKNVSDVDQKYEAAKEKFKYAFQKQQKKLSVSKQSEHGKTPSFGAENDYGESLG